MCVLYSRGNFIERFYFHSRYMYDDDNHDDDDDDAIRAGNSGQQQLGLFSVIK